MKPWQYSKFLGGCILPLFYFLTLSGVKGTGYVLLTLEYLSEHGKDYDLCAFLGQKIIISLFSRESFSSSPKNDTHQTKPFLKLL